MGSYDFNHCGHKQHFACFKCRKAFKARGTFGSSSDREFNCPECKQRMTPMGLLFRAPPQRDIKEWLQLEQIARSSSEPPFQYPQRRPSEGECPNCLSPSGWDGKRCPYCGNTSSE